MTAGQETALLLTFARRGEEEVIGEVIAALRGEHPEARVLAVATPVSATVLEGLGVDETVVYGDGLGARQVIGELRSRHPEAAAIVYWGPGYSGHLKLEALALLAGAKRSYRFAPERQRRTVGRIGLAISVGVKCLKAAVWFVAAGLMCRIASVALKLRQLVSGGRRARRD